MAMFSSLTVVFALYLHIYLETYPNFLFPLSYIYLETYPNFLFPLSYIYLET